MSTQLTGSPGGDTGSYVWNMWVFRHELVDLHTTPFSTESILALDGPTDLSQHNYTVVSALLAALLMPVTGLVAAFNAIYLFKVALAGLGMFLLARHVHRRTGIGTAEAWLAGVLFACSPYLVARSTAHFSLVAIAPLPFFVLCFDRAWRHHLRRDAAAAGACLAWAGFSDPYYAIYCVLLALALMARGLTLERTAIDARTYQPWSRALDTLIVLVSVVVVAIGITDIQTLQVGGIAISMRSLYTPVLILTLLVSTRVVLSLGPRLRWSPSLTGRQFASLVGLMAVVGALLLSPQLVAVAERVSDGRMVRAPVPWRSSAPGLDLMSFLLPNPNHPLAPDTLVAWFAGEPGRFEENVASIPWVALGVILVAWRSRAGGMSRFWTATALLFAAMALGPFIRIAGVDTYVPTPWTFLRYVPLIGEARMPPRMAAVVIMAVAVLFAGALASLVRRYPRHRRRILVGVGVTLAFELCPAPRRLYSAELPGIYRTVANDLAPVRVLELPFGVRDGLSSLGDFTARSQFHQAFHGKPLVGGSLSRISARKKTFYQSWPFLNMLLLLSRPDAPAPAVPPDLLASGPDFIDRINLGYVVMETARMRPELRAFAMDALDLELLEHGQGYELYRPRTTGRSRQGARSSP